MNFNKPPVEEAWIAFKFNLAEESTEWDKETAEYFIKHFFENFKIEGFFELVQNFIDVKSHEIDPVKSQTVFDKIRAFTEEKDYCIQAARDKLVLNQIKKRKWPEYEAMRDKAVEIVKTYMDFRGLNKLSRAFLHYRDVISIPIGTDKSIKLDDYFKIFPQIPEESFRKLMAFHLSAEMENFCEKSRTIITLQSLPLKDSSDGYFKFIMDWHIISIERFDDLNYAVKWLDKAHADLKCGFESAFTEKCLELFEPVRNE